MRLVQSRSSPGRNGFPCPDEFPINTVDGGFKRISFLKPVVAGNKSVYGRPYQLISNWNGLNPNICILTLLHLHPPITKILKSKRIQCSKTNLCEHCNQSKHMLTELNTIYQNCCRKFDCASEFQLHFTTRGLIALSFELSSAILLPKGAF